MSVPLADPDAPVSTPPTGSHTRKPSGAHELKRKGSRILSNMRKTGSAALLGKTANGDRSGGWTREELEAESLGRRPRKTSANGVDVHVWNGDGEAQGGTEHEDQGIGLPFNVSWTRRPARPSGHLSDMLVDTHLAFSQVVHQLHVESDDLSALPPGWVDILRVRDLHPRRPGTDPR